MSEKRVRQPPVATYRLQLRPGFGFDEAAALVDYLVDLGVSHVYLSPVLQAAPESTHGYDVVDHGRVSEDLGGAPAHRRLCERLAEAGIGQLLDIVPNHMAVGPRNPWWWDVLENGPASVYAHFFDVEWAPPEARLRDKVLLPVLGDHAGRVIDAGEIQVRREGGTFTVRYHEHSAPVAPRSLADLLARAAGRCGSADLGFIGDAFARLPPPTETDLTELERRHRDKEVLRTQLARLAAETPAVSRAIDDEVAALNADPDALDVFLSRQNCRLAYWRTAARDLGYRRFFDINSLVALRAEDERVFDATHALVLRWLSEGVVDGLRIDHVDGLYHPLAYLRRLRQAAPGAWLLVEKILERDERLPEDWPVDGTTGYEFLNLLNGLLVHPESEQAFTRLYQAFTAESTDFGDVAKDGKRLVLEDLFGSDLNRLTALFLQICERNRRFRDYSRHEVHEVLREVLIHLGVYRTYLDPVEPRPSPEEEQVVVEAVAAARSARTDLDSALFDFLADLLRGRVHGELEGDLIARFQQVSGPVMAKGVEDTAFYAFTRFAPLNEVGGAPGRFGTSLAAFHAGCQSNQERYPRTLLATATHDTKRGEDVRARLCLLSEIPEVWSDAVRAFSAHNQRHRQTSGAEGWPDRCAEYFYYQTLVGAWPIDRSRAVDYMLKSARERKAHTSWTRPVSAYEAELVSFVERTLADPDFIALLGKFVAPLVEPGRKNGLSQTLLKLTAPGVPDIYQGTELWDLSLVDPDNRRPVDFERRRQLLARLEGATAEEVLSDADSGAPKLWVVRQALRLRRRLPGAFGPQGQYTPLLAEGEHADGVVAFVRGGEVVTVAPRWPVRSGGAWARTRLALPAGRWRNLLTGETSDGGEGQEAQELFSRFPVCLFAREGAA